ncbi:hypothetical protein [Nonomuraea sp. NEAU-A123]|uniref:hypothetical protein n=1 Tax=Nonomuraea sp. NEAU-A123 TaxID=2839649 RepID=UPI001BE4C255|nr:hypothetical protein [Nonomuraea sp. NEAU-A123]MBT2224543.1 hypothetical protein [Nonomuraea sp. NEAU-A123]
MRRMTVMLALLLVAGCAPPDRPYVPGDVRAPATGQTAARPAPTSSQGKTVEVGDGLKVKVEKGTTGNALQRLFADYYVERWKAVETGDNQYLRHLEAPLIPQAGEWVRGFADRKESARGVARLYRLRITAVMGKGAQVDTCVDERGVRLVSTPTGKAVAPQPDWVRAPYLQAVLAHRGDDGVWRIREFRQDKEGCT